MFCSFCGSRNSDNFQFCASCGKQRASIENKSSSISGDDGEVIELVLRPKGVVILLENEKWDFGLSESYKKMVGAKHFDNVIFDAIFTRKRVLLRPVSKSPAHVWILGALITPGLAEATDLLGKKISSLLSETSANLVGQAIDVHVLNSLPTWSAANLYEVKYSLPTLMKSAGTILRFSGISNVPDASNKTTLHLVFEGSAVPSRRQFLEFSRIAKLCGFDPIQAKEF